MVQTSPALPEPSRAGPDPRAHALLSFWREAGPEAWFAKNEAFDADLALRFMALHDAAARGSLDAWSEEPETCLALLLLLDQVPRNLFRGMARAYATDAKAIAVAKAALIEGFDQRVAREERQFFYLPFMHAERLADQDTALALYEALGDDTALHFARLHHEAIARFGRFPHRNPILGRETTEEEAAYLAGGGFAG